jgi:hypothetical protein
MERVVSYLIAKITEFVFFTIAVAIYSNVAYPNTDPSWSREIYLSFAIVFTFFIVSVYILTSLAAHLIFQGKRYFGFFCAGAYALSVLIFVILSPMGGVENILLFIFPLPVIYLIAVFSKWLSLMTRLKFRSQSTD